MVAARNVNEKTDVFGFISKLKKFQGSWWGCVDVSGKEAVSEIKFEYWGEESNVHTGLSNGDTAVAAAIASDEAYWVNGQRLRITCLDIVKDELKKNSSVDH
ncbi:hypothetical protein BGZ76_010347 [Entomortierella beljakovae]|nr:hypothetical protein BGZ76_010347 [Entomortierella beljakovae]